MASGQWGGALQEQPLQARITWEQGGNIAQTGFKLRSVGVTVGTVQDCANEVADFVTESFRTILANGYRVLGIDVVNLVTLEGGTVSPANQMGTTVVSGQTINPQFLTAVVNLRGSIRARYGHGRMFWPVVAEAYGDWNVLNAGGIAAFQGVIDEMTTRYIGNTVSGWNLINAHGAIPARPATPTRPERPAVPPMWYDVTSIRLGTNIGFLRSRKLGVGS